MARAYSCDLRAVLAGAAIISLVIAAGVAVAQEGAEVTEDLGNSYLLARRTTSQGSIIETLLFDGLAIVTEIAVPAPDAGLTTGTMQAVGRAPSGIATPLPAGGGTLPTGLGPGFGGTWLTGEIIDDYLVLHRIRVTDPITHEIFHEGRKVGSVTEVGPPLRSGRSAGRNSFAFESTDDRFVVYLTQPDGTRIRATTEHGRFVNQVIERSAALTSPPRPGVGVVAPLQPSAEPIRPLLSRSEEPQRLARPQEAPGSIMMEEPRPPVVVRLPEIVPLPRPSPLPRTSHTIAVTPVRSATPSPAGNLNRNAAERIVVAPTVRSNPDPAPTVGNARPPAAALRPVAPASAPAAGPKPAVAVAARPPAATPAKPVARASDPAAQAAKPKPAPAIGNTRSPPDGTAKPMVPAVRPRPPPSDASSLR